ncbi:YpmS family protein [Bacillus piscicola]|uniref:YpmS family protein n=1 Tax=Bacillus piscicola TaxID=1632684 RepID=UPI001F08EF95|nr:YpmS family protein [Bacillus piscicola]
MVKKNKNIWKTLFVTLVSLQVLLVLFLFFIVSSPAEKDEKKVAEHSAEETGFQEYFSVHMTKEQLSRLINDQMDQGMDIRITNQHIRVSASYHFLGRAVKAAMEFQPKALENGDIVLHEQSVTVGGLAIPGATVLSLVDSQSELPDYVDVQPADKQIYIQMAKIEIANQYAVKVKRLDLKKNDIYLMVGKREE